jgi:hypothetical protein
MKTTAPRRDAALAPGLQPHNPLDGGEEDVQRGVLHRRVALQVIAQTFGHREHPLAHRQMRDDVVGQMRRRFDHAPGGAGGAHAATLAGVGEDAAFEIAAEFTLGCRWGSLPGTVIVKRQPRRHNQPLARLYRA